VLERSDVIVQVRPRLRSCKLQKLHLPEADHSSP
jgi:hypothetical protein